MSSSTGNEKWKVRSSIWSTSTPFIAWTIYVVEIILQQHFFYYFFWQQLVACLGGPILSGIFARFAQGFRYHRSGLPDLVVWNSSSLDYRVRNWAETIFSRTLTCTRLPSMDTKQRLRWFLHWNSTFRWNYEASWLKIASFKRSDLLTKSTSTGSSTPAFIAHVKLVSPFGHNVQFLKCFMCFCPCNMHMLLRWTPWRNAEKPIRRDITRKKLTFCSEKSPSSRM